MLERYKNNENSIIGKYEKKNVLECLNSNWISYTGKYVNQFEKKFEKKMGNGYAISTCNGTASLILALNVFNVKKNDEVIVPNFMFAAAINAVVAVGATPVVVDVSDDDWLIDENLIKKKLTNKTKAIIVVHSYGIVFDVKKLDFLKKRKKKIFVIEDAAEALGSKYNNKQVGLSGDCSTFSFYPNKNITTGEGGMIVFSKKSFYEKAKIIRNQGRELKDKFFDHKYPGNNFRLSNINAAIGVSQLNRFNKLQNERKKVFKLYDLFLEKKKDQFTKLPTPNKTTNSFWLYTIRLNKISKKKRNKIILNLLKKKIQVRPGFLTLNKQKAYKKYCKNNYKNSVSISNEIISFPTEPFLSKVLIKKICKDFLKQLSGN